MANNREKRKKVLKPPSMYKIFLLGQFAASVVLLYMAKEYLPLPYVIGGVVVAALLLAITSTLTLSYRSIILRFLGKCMCVAVICVMVFGCFKIQKGNETFDKVTKEENQKVITCSVVVMADSPAQSLDDVMGGMIGYNKDYDGNNIDGIVNGIMEKTGKKPTIDGYSQYKYLADGLYEGEVEAIVFNENYRNLLEQGYVNFSTETRILDKIEIVVEEKLADTAVADVTKDCFVAYASGIDTRGAITGTRSDANMLIIVNPTTKQILLLGIPRDYYVTMHSSGKMDKLTHAGLAGIQESIDTIEDFLGLEINYYGRINFNGMIDLIDAVGGINVNSPVEFTTVSDKYHIKKGQNHMSGKMALYFMRSRKMLANGDNDRVSNQIRVIKALMKKLTGSALISNFDQVMDVMQDNFQTNMTSDEIKALMKFQLKEMPEWDIQRIQMTGENAYSYDTAAQPGRKTYVMEPNMDSVAEALALVEQMKNNEMISVKDDHDGGN